MRQCVVDDLYKNAYLLWRRHRLKVEPDAHRARFVFPATAADDAKEFDSGAIVPAAAFSECLRRIKRLLHEARGDAKPEWARGPAELRERGARQ